MGRQSELHGQWERPVLRHSPRGSIIPQKAWCPCVKRASWLLIATEAAEAINNAIQVHLSQQMMAEWRRCMQ